jgi:hypothetical protein
MLNRHSIISSARPTNEQPKLGILKEKLGHGCRKFHLSKPLTRHSFGKVALIYPFGVVWVPYVYKLLCLDPFAGRAGENELFRTHSEFWKCAEVLHGVAATEAHDSACTLGYSERAFDSRG